MYMIDIYIYIYIYIICIYIYIYVIYIYICIIYIYIYKICIYIYIYRMQHEIAGSRSSRCHWQLENSKASRERGTSLSGESGCGVSPSSILGFRVVSVFGSVRV